MGYLTVLTTDCPYSSNNKILVQFNTSDNPIGVICSLFMPKNNCSGEGYACHKDCNDPQPCKVLEGFHSNSS